MMTERKFPEESDNYWEEQLSPSIVLIPQPLLDFIRPNQLLIAEKTEIFRSTKSIPVIQTLFDGSRYWLTKDVELLLAARHSLQPLIMTQVSHGSARQAVLNFIKNTTYTLSYRKRYEQALATMLLTDPEWSKLSNQEIAELCNLSTYRVQMWRQMILNQGPMQTVSMLTAECLVKEVLAHPNVNTRVG
jgi:hypothetical protein